jgi:hypothetical protein
MKSILKFQVAVRKPRNPMASLARGRRAGAHGAGNGALRQRARRALRQEITHSLDSP